MRITNITPFLVVSLCADEVLPFSFFGRNLGKRQRSLLKSSEDSPAFFASAVVEEIVDVSIPYDAAARLAYESSNQTMGFERFKTVYLERAVELVKSKQPGYVPSAPYEPADVSVPYDAAARLAYESSETRLLFEAYKAVYIEEMVTMVTLKNKARKRNEFASKFTPKPPISPPPVPKVFDEKFAKLVDKLEERKDETFAKVADFVKTIEFTKPEMQEGVPEESIKGAALLTAGLALLSTKGVVVSSAAGIGAVYAAMQKGQVGDVFRSFGSVTWDATEAATQLIRAATADERVTGLSKELAAKAAGAIDKYQREQMATKKRVDAPKTEESAVAEEILENSPELVAQFLEEVEAVIDQADAAMALADETLGKADIKLDDAPMDKDEGEEVEAAVSSSADDLLGDKPEELDEEEEEVVTTVYDTIEGDDEVPVNEDADEEAGADEFDDDWAAILELAQQGIGAKIVGMDEIITDQTAKADWDAATKRAEELNQVGESIGADEEESVMIVDNDEEATSDSDEDLDDLMPEGGLEAIGPAAREVVAMSSKSIIDDDEDLDDLIPEGDLEAIARAAREAVTMSSETVVEEDEEVFASSDDEGFDAVEDMLPEGDLEDIARAAREAVAMSSEGIIDDDEDLDDLMPEGDMEAIAREAREAVAMSSETIIDDDEDLDNLIPEGDMEAIARAAREAVAMSSETVVDDDEDEEVFASSDDEEFDAVENMLPEGDLEDIARAAREAVAMSSEGIIDDDEDLDDLMPEGDMEAIARAAREAVAMSTAALVDDKESDSDSDLEAIDEMMPEGDLEEIARLAREAVTAAGQNVFDDDDDDFEDVSDMFSGQGDLEAIGTAARNAVSMSGAQDGSDKSSPQLPLRDWSKLTVTMLREECKVRGIRAYGRKAELVTKLNQYELEFYQSDTLQTEAAEDSTNDDSDWELEMADIDLAEIGKQARAAVQAYEDLDDHDDYVEEAAIEPASTIEQETSAPVVVDFSKMTVVELKENLRSRGLRVSGKKAELIERLQSA
ncbi:MAG: hypothetical protein SGBAC_006081 [Bacillariaceae sp.]